MTGADVPAAAQEAREAAFTAWCRVHGDDGMWAGWEAGWVAALEWAAPMIDEIHNCAVEGDCPYCAKLASLLRQGGEGGTE